MPLGLFIAAAVNQLSDDDAKPFPATVETEPPAMRRIRPDT
jgi:hypothetical protein